VDRALLTALARPAPGDVADDVGFWQDGAVGLAHTCRVGVVHEQQPLVDPATGCVIVFEGRLDNRRELRGALATHERVLVRDTDAAYALAAYLEWDDRAPDHLLGDFALAIWDPRARRLLLANDPTGMRPVYYSTWANRLTFASTLEQMLDDPALPRDIDEDALLRFLYPDGSTPGPQTHYRQIRLLPGGHRLLVEGSRVALTRYWTWPAHPPEPRLASAADADEFRTLFEDAVRCRLRGTAPAGLALSGGLDSGAIACMAGHLRQQNGAPTIRAYSMVFDELAACDERVYSQAAAARYGLEHSCVPADDCWSLARVEEWLPVFTEPFFGMFDDAWYKILGQARADGVRLMMTGDGGDFLVGGSPFYLSDWLLQGRWGALSKEIRARASRSDRSYLRVFGPAIHFLLPIWLQRRVQHPGLPDLDAWIPPHLRERHHAHMGAPLYRGRYAWWHQLHDLVEQFTHGYHNACRDRQMRRFGLEVCQPFFDVRLIQFVLRAPPDLFYHDDTFKVVLREALHDILPPVIRDRRDKASFTPLARLGLCERRRGFVEALLEDSELERRGYVVPGPWKRHLHECLQQRGMAYWALWRTLTAEMWLRHLVGRLPSLQ
jgi:asparagine synthase (glutamine-hydrolysing)